MAKSYPSPKEVVYKQRAAFAERFRKSNVMQDITMLSENEKLSESSNSQRSSQNFQEVPKIRTHFGSHLLKDLKKVKQLEVTSSRMKQSNDLHIETPTRLKDFNCSSVKATKKVVPFGEKLVAASCRAQSQTVSHFSSPRTRHEAMEQSTPQRDFLDWDNRMSPISFSQNMTTISDLQEYTPKGVKNPRQQPKFHSKPNWEAIQDFRKLGLTFDQIWGLEYLGFPVTRFLSHESIANHDTHVPPSFELGPASCYWCESPPQIAYGVAFILMEDVRVVGVEVQWDKRSQKPVLIEIATSDVVLLVPIGPDDISAPKALHIIFRNPEIVKVGVKIKMNLKVLWENFQIESNSYIDLNELLQFSSSKIRNLLDHPETQLNLQAIACLLGYQKWQTSEVIYSNWDSRPLSWRQLRHAARNAMMTILIFWSIVLGRRISKPVHTADLDANIWQLVDSVCTRGPISRSYENFNFNARAAINDMPGRFQLNRTPISSVGMDSIASDSLGLQDDRLSTSPDTPPGLSESSTGAFFVGDKHKLVRYEGLL